MNQQSSQTIYCEILRKNIPKKKCQPNDDHYCNECSHNSKLKNQPSQKKIVPRETKPKTPKDRPLIESPIDPHTGRIKDLMFACDGDNLDQVFGELVIKPLLADAEGIKTLCNRPSKEQIKSLSEYQVSDEECLELVETDLEYLHARFTQEKIKRWKGDQKSTDKDKASKASENLGKIASILTFKGWDKPGLLPTLVAQRRYRVYSRLKEEGIHKLRSEGRKRIKLTELFGSEVIDSIDDILSPLADLANQITGAILGLSELYIQKELKKCQSLEVKGSKVFILKKTSKR